MNDLLHACEPPTFTLARREMRLPSSALARWIVLIWSTRHVLAPHLRLHIASATVQEKPPKRLCASFLSIGEEVTSKRSVSLAIE